MGSNTVAPAVKHYYHLERCILYHSEGPHICRYCSGDLYGERLLELAVYWSQVAAVLWLVVCLPSPTDCLINMSTWDICGVNPLLQ